MSIALPLIHFLTVASAICLPAIGVSFGEAMIGFQALKALDRQPNARPQLLRTLIVGMALTETAAVIGLALAIMLIFGEAGGIITLESRIAELGIAFAIGLPGFIIGLASARPAIASLHAIARQPLMARKITNLMLIAQSIGQTGIIFGFIASLFIMAGMKSLTNMNDALRLLASGMAIGIGTLGPAYGLGHFAHTSVDLLGYRPESYGKILTFTFISEAIIETPIIFALVVSLILATTTATSTTALEGLAFLAASLVMGIGTFSTGINSARVAASAATQISNRPDAYSVLSRISLIGQTLIDTSALYALLTAILIIFNR